MNVGILWCAVSVNYRYIRGLSQNDVSKLQICSLQFIILLFCSMTLCQAVRTLKIKTVLLFLGKKSVRQVLLGDAMCDVGNFQSLLLNPSHR